MAGFSGMEAREYKLLLKPSWVAREGVERIAAEILPERLRKTAENYLAERRFEPAWRGDAFELEKKRKLRYWDTENQLLSRHDYALRERTEVRDDAKEVERKEVTLKLRTPDLFVAASAALPGARHGARTKLEEDIAPLEVEQYLDGVKRVVLAERRSIRSRFTLSTTQLVSVQRRLDTLDDGFELYPTLKKNLRMGQPERIGGDTELLSGRRVREFVHKGPKLALGDGIAAWFCLTFWYFKPDLETLGVAEVSFKCMLKAGGSMPVDPARRALALFIGMQNDLAEVVDLEEASKTALALRPEEA
jgi:hypothetical protein